MTTSRIMVRIDAGAHVAQDTVDALTRELLAALNEQSGFRMAELATEPAEAGAKVGVETVMIGDLVLFGGELTKKTAGKVVDAFCEWLNSVHKRFKDPVYVTIPTPNGGTLTIASNQSKDEVLNALRVWVEAPD